MSALLNSTTDFADSTDDKTEPLCWKAISVIRVIGVQPVLSSNPLTNRHFRQYDLIDFTKKYATRKPFNKLRTPRIKNEKSHFSIRFL